MNLMRFSACILFVALTHLSFGQTTIVSYDFDTSDEGWTVTTNLVGDWSRGVDIFSGGADGSYWYTSPSNYNTNDELVIQSPVIDLSGRTGMIFSMDFRYDTENRWDGFQVEYSANGGSTWTDLGAFGEGNNWYEDTDVDAIANGADGWTGDNGGWETGQIDIPAVLENNSTARFRVRFQSDFVNEDVGVAFDNVIITSGVDIQVEGNGVEIVDGDASPSTTDDTDFGILDISSGTRIRTFTISNVAGGTLNLTGGSPVTISGTHSGDFTVTSQPASSALNFTESTTFTVEFDPSALGVRTATVSVANDDPNEDPYTFDLHGTGVNAVVNHNFNSSDHSWTVTSNTNGDWARGTGIHSAGADGSYWHTTPTTPEYNTNAVLTIQSPTFDLTGETELLLYMDIRYATEAAWDGFEVEYSDNGGAWTNLGAVGDGVNWYNDTDVDAIANGADGWSGDNGVWQTALIELPAALENNNNVRIRITFESDFITNDVGVAFDNFMISAGVPDIMLEGNGLEIADGDDSPYNLDDTDFRSVDITQGTKEKTYTITNVGGGTLTLTGGTPVTITGSASADYTVTSQPASSSLGYNESTTFTVLFNPSAAGARNATVNIASNDSDEGTFNFDIVGTGDNAVVFNDFDGGDEGWAVTSNTNGDWSRGTGILSAGADGSYWHTTPTTPEYNADAVLIVQSSVIDFTGESNLALYMDIRYDTEAAWDGYQVEYSTDGGTNWSDLGAVSEGINWYNDTDVDGIANNEDGWSGDNGVWQTAEFDLPIAIDNNATTRFRVIFQSDNTQNDVGVAFDNFIIFGDVAALPVELIDFAGIAQNNSVVLDWSTATELNNDFFEVQRSSDGVSFEAIGTIDGNGTTNQVMSYSFTDQSPNYGANFYRLRQVDFDGTQEIHRIIKVDNDFIRTGMDANIYPNPSVPENLNLNISSGDDHTSYQIQILDQSGRVFYQKVMNGTLNMNERIYPAAEMKSGLYFLIIRQGDNQTKQKLIIR